jgi:xylulokinase
VLEGVTFGMRDAIEIMNDMHIPIKEVRASGGGARSGFWRELQANIYRHPIVLTNASEGPAYGVALLAGVGTGVWKSVEEACKSSIRQTMKVAPAKRAADVYEKHYQVYRKLYHDLKQRYAEIAALA